MAEQSSVSDVKNSGCNADGTVCQQPSNVWRREKLTSSGSSHSVRDESLASSSSELTQAGHRRLRISVACETCRMKKLKCDALKPTCSICLRKKLTCQYPTAGRRRRETAAMIPGRSGSEQSSLHSSRGLDSASQDQESTTRNALSPIDDQIDALQQLTASPEAGRSDEGEDSHGRTDNSNAATPAPGTLLGWESPHLRTPVGPKLLPYIDSLLENVHPISCNNFLHPGSVCEALHRAPHLLVLAICGSSAKFMPGASSKSDGRRWVEEAKMLIMKNLDRVSTLTMSAIQFLVLHEMHEAEYTSAWNLAGKFNQFCPRIYH